MFLSDATKNFCLPELRKEVFGYGRKTAANLSYVTVGGEEKMERARVEQHACAIVSPPSPYLGWLAVTREFVTVTEARRYLATSITEQH
jgi:hypothetical protein